MNHLEKQVQQKQQLKLRFCYFITIMRDLATTSFNHTEISYRTSILKLLKLGVKYGRSANHISLSFYLI